MLKLIINFILLILGNTYELIDTNIQINDRPIYISGRIIPEQKKEIRNAIQEFNNYFPMVETENKLIPHTRIQYGDIIGGTHMSATTTSDGKFIIDKSIITFNKRLTGNTLGCVIIHEILHSRGLYHSDVEGSIMNYTVKMTTDGEIIQTERCDLTADDVDGLNYINYFNK